MRITRSDESNSSILPKVILVPFPEEKYRTLVEMLGYQTEESLTFPDYRKIFVNAVYLFLKGAWSLDELSAMANTLWGSKEEKFDEFGSALYECAELNFYVRNIYNPSSPDFRGQFDEFMITTIKFYEKYFSDVVNAHN